MYHQYITFSSFIDGQSLYLSIHDDTLSMNNFVLKLKHGIKGIALGKEKFFLVFADFESDGDIYHTNQPNNNVSAYDYTGRYLYNIGDIVPKTANYTYATIRMSETKNGINYPYPEITQGHEYLTCFAWDRNYIVDITDDKFIKVEDSR